MRRGPFEFDGKAEHMVEEKSKGPLNGLVVMDVSIMAAGPWTAALLGMLGAEVIKIEPPDGDGTRWVEPTQNGMGTNFISMNVNKKDMTLDLKHPGDNETARKLASKCDIFVQNFRVGVIERLGLDYETLRKINPRIIYCAISGFGEVGPLAKTGCADSIMQAFSGFASLNGAPYEELEAFRFTGFLDLTTAGIATEAVLAALVERETTGLGQKVEVSMLEAALEIQGTRVSQYLGAHQVPPTLGSGSALLAPDQAFATLDVEIFVTAHNEEQWRGVCDALGLSEIAEDPLFGSNLLRVNNRDLLVAILGPVFKTRPSLWWLRALRRRDVPCSIAHTFETFRDHAQIIDNGMIAGLETHWGKVNVAGLPWHFLGTPCEVMPPPIPGENTAEIRSLLAQTSLPSGEVIA